MKTLGAILLAAGILALIYGGFTYDKKKGDADLGPLKIEINEEKRVNVPVWGGVAASVVGGVLLAAGSRK